MDLKIRRKKMQVLDCFVIQIWHSSQKYLSSILSVVHMWHLYSSNCLFTSIACCI